MRKPEAYRWSSHRAFLGKELLPWLNTDVTLSRLSDEIGKARQGFAAFVAEGLTEGHRPEFHGQGMTDSRCIGADWFVEQSLAKSEAKGQRAVSIQKLVAAVCDGYGIGEPRIRAGGRLAAEARGVAALLVLQFPGCSLERLAEMTGRDASTLSSAQGESRQELRQMKSWPVKLGAWKAKLQLCRLDPNASCFSRPWCCKTIDSLRRENGPGTGLFQH